MLLEKEHVIEKASEGNADFDANDILKYFLGSIKKGKRRIFIALVIGTILGVAFYFFKKPIYSSQMMGYSETLKKEIIFNIVEDLQRLIDQSDYEQLKKFLNLSEKSVKSIVALKAQPAIERSIYETEESSIFIIEAKVDDLTVLDSLSEAIGHYVDNNRYVKIRLEREKGSILNSIEKMQIEISDLEKLKIDMREALSKNTYRTNLFLSDIGYSSSKIVELYEKENALKTKLEFLYDIKILSDFVKFKKKKEPRLIVSVLGFQSLALFVLFVFWFFGRVKTTWDQL